MGGKECNNNICSRLILGAQCENNMSCFVKIAGTLTGEEIKEHQLIHPEPNSPEDCYQATTYDLTLGEGHYIYNGFDSGKSQKWELIYIGESDARLKKLNENSASEQYNRLDWDKPQTLSIPPYGSAFVQLNETVDTYTVAKEKGLLVVGRFDLKLSNVHQGLISQQATQVEPCYKGKLFCFIHNLSNQCIQLKYGQKMATIEFSYVSCFCNGQKRREIIDSLIFRNKKKYDKQYCIETGINDIRYFHSEEQLPDDCGLLGIDKKVKEYLDSEKVVEEIAKAVQKRVDKRAKWIPVITAIIPILASILLAIFGLPKKEDVDNLESVVEKQEETINDLEDQLQVLLNNS